MSIKANGRKNGHPYYFLHFNVNERMKMQSAAPSLFVGLSSADRDALGEDYMAKIS